MNNKNYKKLALLLMAIITLIALAFFVYSYFNYLLKKSNKTLIKDSINITNSNSAGQEYDILSKAELNEKFSPVIKYQANLVAQAFKEKDYEKVAYYTHPQIIQITGGKQAYINFLNEKLSGPDSPTFLELSVENPINIIDTGNSLQAILAENIVGQVNGGILKTKGYLIAISYNKGENWYFIDTSGHNNIEELRETFPELSPNLVIPTREKPTFYKN